MAIPRKLHRIGVGLTLIVAVLLMATADSPAQSRLPLFQLGVFYDMDLDLSPGQAMTMNNLVFCNGNIWSWPSASVTFNGPVGVAGKYFFHWDTNGEQEANISPDPVPPVYNDGQPVSGLLPLTFAASTNNFESLLDLPPTEWRAPQQIAYETTNELYFFNSASLIVSNSYFGTNGIPPWSNNFTVYFQDSSFEPTFIESNSVGWHWIRLTNDFYIVSNQYNGVTTIYSTNYVPSFRFTGNVSSIRWTNTIGYPLGTNTVWYAGFSFLTNAAFYDYRESNTVQAVQLDVGRLRAWITNSGPNGGSKWSQDLAGDWDTGINSVYVYNAVPFVSRQQLPSVSIVDGGRLPNSTNAVSGGKKVTSGLTVVTPQPLYVIGDYNVLIDGGTNVAGTANTANTYPAGLYADAITVLSSNNWPADWNQSAYTARPAANITINAACISGIVPSTGGQNEGGDGPSARYSGGIENYFRLLENWSGYTLTYNGSMSAMFSSVYATNDWQLPDIYYGIPTRHFAYDTNFNLIQDLPPLTPQIVNDNYPLIGGQPTNQTVVAGGTATFTVTVADTLAPTYQWQFNGIAIPDNTNVLSLPDVTAANTGNYAAVVSSLGNSVTSSAATLTVVPVDLAVPSINLLSDSAGNGFQFQVSGFPGFNYTVEASTNLVDWVPLASGNSPFIFTDTNADFPQRFYRGVYAP